MSRQLKFSILPTQAPKKRFKRAHVSDAGAGIEGYPYGAQFTCGRCGWKSKWICFDNQSKIRKGVICPTCNNVEDVDALPQPEMPSSIMAWGGYDKSSATGSWSANTYYDETAVEYMRKSDHEAEIAKLKSAIRKADADYEALEQKYTDYVYGSEVSS